MANGSENLHQSLSHEPEAPLSPVVLASREQQEATFFALYYHLLVHTLNEAEGGLKAKMVNENDALRGILKQLAISLGRERDLRPEDWLVVGVLDFVPGHVIHKWAHIPKEHDWTQDRFYKVARYFKRKLPKGEQEDS